MNRDFSGPSVDVVITGIGLISPLGNDVAGLVEKLRAGVSGIGPLDSIAARALPVNFGAPATSFTGHIDDYGPLDKAVQRTIRKGSKVMCREIEMGVAAAQRAIGNSGLTIDETNRDRIGVTFGCDYIMSRPEEYADAIAACSDFAKNGREAFDFSVWGKEGLPKVNPLWLLKYLPNMPASHIAIYNDLRGPNNSITMREASAGAAIAEAVSTLRRGHADVLIVGATGSRIHPLRSLHTVMQETLAADRDDPATMARPFDASRDGGVMGEGAAALILETAENAAARGATVLGRVLSASTAAAGHRHCEDPIRVAIANAIRGTGCGRPGHVHAHGLGTMESDESEAAAIADVFGRPGEQPPITTAKGHFGNLAAGGGMVEIVASLASLGGDLFPIANLTDLDERCPINAVTSGGVPAGEDFVSVNVTPQCQAAAVWIGR